MKHTLRALLLIGLPSFAGAAPSQSLVDYINGNVDIDKTIYSDLDGDSVTEAITIDRNDCSPAGCLFEVVEDDDFGIRVSARQYGKKIQIVSQGRVIDANGVYWTWNGSDLTPYSSLLENMTSRKATKEETLDILRVAPWHKEVNSSDVDVYDIDLVGNPRPEKLMRLIGTQFMSGNAQPYFIFDQEGELIEESVTSDLPIVFRYKDTDQTVILTPVGSTWSTSIFER